MFGWTAEEVHGRTFAEIGMVYEPDLPRVLGIANSLSAGVTSNVCENRNLTKSVGVVHCRWFNSRVPLGDGGYG